jgi:two-component system, NtrC family, C4-dicarboxylate transport response regulator DctD
VTTDVILVDDEQHLRTACTQALELAGMTVTSFASADEALGLISRTWPGILVTDIKMSGMNGLQLMNRALELDPELPVILITGHGDIPMAVQAIQDGAYDFIEKPFPSELLVDASRRALEKRTLILENRSLREALASGTELESTIIGRSPEILRLRAEIESFATTDADVLIIGETGSGKELVARSLNESSDRQNKTFVPINCGALPESIIESELFGHDAGAFTGANKSRVGKFEYADGGTLFLDEIESMPLELQVRLLRVLQDRKIVRLGSNKEIPVDVRVVAATKEDLLATSARGDFREDLYYRLNVLVLRVPPLRDRTDDVPLLFSHFVARAAERFRKDMPEIAAADLAMLKMHTWPGNVRELENVAMRFAMGLGLDTPTSAASATDPASSDATLPEQTAAFEKLVLQKALAQSPGNLKAVYESLGISRKTLYDKIRKHDLGDINENQE